MENPNAPIENYTPEEIQQHINNAFDSVNFINELNALSFLNNEQQEAKDRNIDHIKIMMEREWFSSALTEEQKDIIMQLIP